jgi:DNA-binding XRE family transcriptional regulator
MRFDRTKIKELREQHGMNTTQFALKLDTSRQRVENWEKRQCYPNIDAITKMCSVFGVEIDFFLTKN